MDAPVGGVMESRVKHPARRGRDGGGVMTLHERDRRIQITWRRGEMVWETIAKDIGKSVNVRFGGGETFDCLH